MSNPSSMPILTVLHIVLNKFQPTILRINKAVKMQSTLIKSKIWRMAKTNHISPIKKIATLILVFKHSLKKSNYPTMMIPQQRILKRLLVKLSRKKLKNKTRNSKLLINRKERKLKLMLTLALVLIVAVTFSRRWLIKTIQKCSKFSVNNHFEFVFHNS